MIRMIQSTSASHAKAYFSEALLKSDYYISDQELQGRIHGKIADRLGLKGAADKETFYALCDNINPNTGENLTPRTKEERTAGYDINFHCPKSVSIIHALSKDDHILKAFEDCVQETMLDIEQDSKTRVRKNQTYDDRDTGELIWADFTHQTARPIEDAAPDPHLHSHCFVFNATFDSEENKFKAGQFRNINRDMPYYQARFHKRLADRMMSLGYQVRQTKTSFEIEGVPQKVIDLFSKRTDEIGRVAREQGITDAKQKSQLGAKTRGKKQKGLSMDVLQADWRQQIHSIENIEEDSQKEVRYARDKMDTKTDEVKSANKCVTFALSHCFERASVMQDRRLLANAYRYGLGNVSVSIQAIDSRFEADENILQIKEKGRIVCTTKEILQEERKMVQLAVKAQNASAPIYHHFPALQGKGEQAEAIHHLLTNSDGVSIVRGAAGTGKTTMMTTAIDLMIKAGKTVTVLAPSANASRGVLRDEGFYEANTVAKFLQDPKMQDKIKNQVLWIDEAGLLGTKDMTRLLEISAARNAKLILSGDTRQHASVVRGDALRILNTVAGIKASGLTEIRRQKEERFRSAIDDLSQGQIRNGFEKLEAIDFIKQVDPLNANEDLVNDYVEAVKKGKDALIVSPTHKQGEEVTKAIRNKLKTIGRIGKKEIAVLQFRNLNLTEAQKADSRNFREGQFIQFNQNVSGIKRGSKWTVQQMGHGGVNVKSEDDYVCELPLNKSGAFDVFEKTEIKLAKGDKIRLTKNAFDKKRQRMDNGQVLNVVSVLKIGKVVLGNTKGKSVYEIDRQFGHLAHAHCITSHASQGKTVDEVFISQPAATFGATDAKQFYVSVSRARDKATIYTDDRDMLLEHASALGERQSAIELTGDQWTHADYVHHHEITLKPGIQPAKRQEREIASSQEKDRGYEPGF